MQYRVVYDVLDDVALPGQVLKLYFLGGAVFFTLFSAVLTYCIRARAPESGIRTRPFLIVGTIFMCIGSLMVVTGTYPLYVDQQRCKEWARGGAHDMAEGMVADFRRDAGKYPPTHFRVGNDRFTYQGFEPTVGGFHGDFTAPGTDGLKLHDGLPVRVAHRDGRVLRIEVGE